MMEHDVREYLKRIVWTIFSTFLWLSLTVGIGAYNNLLVPEHGLHTGNIIFYIWSVGSLVALVFFFFRIWKKKYPHG